MANQIPKENGCERVCSMGDACCKKAFSSEPTEIFNSKDFCPYDPSQELIFPPKLQVKLFENSIVLFNCIYLVYELIL